MANLENWEKCDALRQSPRQIPYHDAARRVATVFEKLHCLIRTKEGPPYKGLNPYGSLPRFPLWNGAV